MQSNVFERSVRTALVWTPRCRDLHHFSIISKRQCCVLKPFRKHFVEVRLKLVIHEPFIAFTERCYLFSVLLSVLNVGVMSAF